MFAYCHIIKYASNIIIEYYYWYYWIHYHSKVPHQLEPTIEVEQRIEVDAECL